MQSQDNYTANLLTEIYRSFDFFNQELGANLPKPVITIERHGASKCGHFANSCWNDGEKALHEISLNGCQISDPIETLHTLLHEMAHMANYVEHGKVVDCTPQQRHNGIFKVRAEKFGMNCGNDKRFGSGITELNEFGRQLIENLQLDYKVYELYTQAQPEKEKKQRESKLAPVMIDKDTKALVAETAEALGCDQKELAEKALKYYIHLLNTNADAIPEEFRIELSEEGEQ